tara:strand:- start:240 stop:569 length:330 start_codon:yes stop_codon:yes gene_type:complete
MADGRVNNGAKKGEYRGQGRKPKAEEQKVKRMCENAIIKVFGSVEKYYVHLAKQSKESFPHLKLLMEYYIGKPKENKEVVMEQIQPLFPDEPLSDDELRRLNKIIEEKY